MIASGRNHGAQWDAIQYKITEAGNTIRYAKGEMDELVESGKAFTLGRDSELYLTKLKQLEQVNDKMRVYGARVNEIKAKEQRTASAVASMGNIAKKTFSGLGKVVQGISGGLKKLGNAAKSAFSRMHKDTKKENGLLQTLKSRLSGITLSLLIFNWITKGFNAMVLGMKEGFQELVKYSSEYNESISVLMSANQQMKNSLTTAFAPIVKMIIPYLVQLINYVISAANVIAQFAALLSGKDTWIRAKEVQVDYTDSLDGTADAAENAKKALEGYLSPIDEINKYNPKDSDANIGAQPGTVFEEVEVDDKVKGWFESFKDIMESLFAPLKQAWNRQGKKVIDAWRDGLKEIKLLAKSIGSDFLEVWSEEKTVHVIEDMLIILADMGRVVENLTRNFRLAWEENEMGKKILQNIRDIFAIIVEHAREAADFTVDWSNNVDFTPLLTSFEEFTRSLQPVVDFLSGVISDFYTQVLLPLGQWVIEKGLPDLLRILSDFNDSVDWEGLREKLSDFWDHLEPFAETIGEGLLRFIEDAAIALADFLNSSQFEEFLDSVAEWMDEVEPEDVAKGLKGIVTALVGFKVLSALAPVFSMIATLIGAIAKGAKPLGVVGGILSSMVEFIKSVNWVNLFNVAPENFIASIDYLERKFIDWDKIYNTEGLGEVLGGINDFLGGIAEWIGENVIKKLFEAIGSVVKMFIEPQGAKSFSLYSDAVKETAESLWGVKDGITAIDEELQALEPTLDATNEKTSTLGTTTATTHADMEKLAEAETALWDETPETLAGVIECLEKMDQGEIDNMTTLEDYGESLGLTEDALDYLRLKFEEVSTSAINEGENSGTNFAESFLAKLKEKLTGIGAVIGMVAGTIPVNISGISTKNIPGYATGQVIPAGMSSHLAILGDNNRETEIVSPLSTMKQAVKEVIQESGGSGGGTYILPLIFDGAELLRIMIKNGKIVQMQTGENPFELE